ncbi:hypothetical protein DASC09_045530 [Saccharomycopsis crataegensis]|uniref:NADH:flavin oxidoreductase/NADH oxidase N-terminal domain-containing protein n=1 Tax=Saccharomycopsis crataegensis TaxID=43959 RepID=A0AAV5QSV9_9ASCO|nr:hypothetical protein DASC09_045530 [Saccharomycopsis crataegensis]
MSTEQVAQSNLFKPIRLNKNVELSHRIAIPPLTRARATKDHVPTDLMAKYYDDRTKTPGSLIVAEGTFVCPEAVGWGHAPGIWSDRQVKAWKQINDKVHANKSFISCQLWNLGRQADPVLLKEVGIAYKSASDVYIDEETEKKAKEIGNPLTPLTKEEIKNYVENVYPNAAQNAIEGAGFDFVEIHGAHGYIFDQFFQETSNKRTDEYGPQSIENRSRFFFEVLDSIVARLGGDGSKVAVRISPWAFFGGMEGNTRGIEKTKQEFGYIVEQLEQRRQKYGLAYLSIVEPRVSGVLSIEKDKVIGDNEWIFDLFKGVVLRSGTYYSFDKQFTALLKDVNNNDRTLIGIGRPAISNPDIVERLRNGWDAVYYDRDTFYVQRDDGYNTYGFHGQEAPKFSEEQKLYAGVPLA